MTTTLGHTSPVQTLIRVTWAAMVWPSGRAPSPSFGHSSMSRVRRRRMDRDLLDVEDHLLVAQLADSDAMTELIRRHRNRLMAMAIPMIRNRSDAEEIVQDTFVQAFRSAESFRGDAKVSTWLHSICYRQVLSRTRRKRHLTVAIDRTVEPVAETRDDAFRLSLETAVDELPAINREAFVLVEMLGFSRADAAAIVAVEANTMRARLARAHSLLADALSEDVMS